MVRKLIIGVVLTAALSAIAGSAYAEDAALKDMWGGDTPGLFCKVENPDVCVIAQTEEDCKKLGGVKADSCPMPEKEQGE